MVLQHHNNSTVVALVARTAARPPAAAIMWWDTEFQFSVPRVIARLSLPIPSMHQAIIYNILYYQLSLTVVPLGAGSSEPSF